MMRRMHGNGRLVSRASLAAVVFLAATCAQAADQAVVTTRMTWGQMMEYGGWLMYVLGLISFAALALVIYLFAVLRAGQVAPPVLRRELIDKLKSGADDDARRAAEFRSCALSSVVLAVMDYLREIPDADPNLLKDVAQGEGVRQADAIQGQVEYLLDMATIAPMVGLLGTVVGMVTAFGAVAHDIASAKPVVLAAGVSQALITTVGGLVIGIPAMVFYAYFRRRASKLISYLESASTDVLAVLISKRS
jgi:biopolymer transport protein ExbB